MTHSLLSDEYFHHRTLLLRACILIALGKMIMTFLCGLQQCLQFSDKINMWEKLADARGKCEPLLRMHMYSRFQSFLKVHTNYPTLKHIYRFKNVRKPCSILEIKEANVFILTLQSENRKKSRKLLVQDI